MKYIIPLLLMCVVMVGTTQASYSRRIYTHSHRIGSCATQRSQNISPAAQELLGRSDYVPRGGRAQRCTQTVDSIFPLGSIYPKPHIYTFYRINHYR